jgi:hypothetical protein
MLLYTFKSQFVSVTKKSGHQVNPYKGGLLYPSYCPHLSTIPSFISTLVGGVTL